MSGFSTSSQYLLLALVLSICSRKLELKLKLELELLFWLKVSRFQLGLSVWPHHPGFIQCFLPRSKTSEFCSKKNLLFSSPEWVFPENLVIFTPKNVPSRLQHGFFLKTWPFLLQKASLLVFSMGLSWTPGKVQKSISGLLILFLLAKIFAQHFL